MATCLAETIAAAAATSGFNLLSEKDKLSVLLQSIYVASSSSDDLDTLMTAANTAGFSKIADKRYKACILLRLMAGVSGDSTEGATAILAKAAASQFMFLSEAEKQSATLQLLSDYNDVDADAAAFISTAGITDETEQAAIIALVGELKAGDLWATAVGLYPIVGGTQAKFAYNLVDPATFEITWVGTMDVSALGVASDGSSYGLTGITRTDIGTTFSLAAYQCEPAAGPSFPQHISSYENPLGSPRELGHNVASVTTVRVSASDSDSTSFGGDNSGLFTLTCTSGGNWATYRRTNVVDPVTPVVGVLTSNPTADFGVLSRWSGSAANLFNTGHDGFFAFYAEDITSKLAAFNTAMENFQTALSRNA